MPTRPTPSLLAVALERLLHAAEGACRHVEFAPNGAQRDSTEIVALRDAMHEARVELRRIGVKV